VLEVFDRLKTPGGLELLMILGLVFAFFAAIVLAGLGGVLGGAIFNRRGRT
jgi:high-affinity Fe2+/Pb2+ permease